MALQHLHEICRRISRRAVAVETETGTVRGVLTSWTSKSVWLVDDADRDIVLSIGAIRGLRLA